MPAVCSGSKLHEYSCVIPRDRLNQFQQIRTANPLSLVLAEKRHLIQQRKRLRETHMLQAGAEVRSPDQPLGSERIEHNLQIRPGRTVRIGVAWLGQRVKGTDLRTGSGIARQSKNVR